MGINVPTLTVSKTSDQRSQIPQPIVLKNVHNFSNTAIALMAIDVSLLINLELIY